MTRRRLIELLGGPGELIGFGLLLLGLAYVSFSLVLWHPGRGAQGGFPEALMDSYLEVGRPYSAINFDLNAFNNRLTVQFVGGMEGGVLFPDAPLVGEPLSLVAVGEANHVGRYTAEIEQAIDLDEETFTASLVLETPNGDRIFATAEGVIVPMTDFSGALYMEGGTGRFAGLSGRGFVFGEYGSDGTFAAEWAMLVGEAPLPIGEL